MAANKKTAAKKGASTKKARSTKAKTSAGEAKQATAARSEAKEVTAQSTKQGTKQKTMFIETMETMMSNKPFENFQFDKLAQEAQATGKENMEALAQSSSVFAKGFENIFKNYMSWAQESAEKNTQAFQTLMGCKTLNEFTTAQNQLAQENFDDFLSNFSQFAEMSVKVTTEALEPINEQLTKAMKNAGRAAA